MFEVEFEQALQDFFVRHVCRVIRPAICGGYCNVQLLVDIVEPGRAPMWLCCQWVMKAWGVIAPDSNQLSLQLSRLFQILEQGADEIGTMVDICQLDGHSQLVWPIHATPAVALEQEDQLSGVELALLAEGELDGAVAGIDLGDAERLGGDTQAMTGY